MEFKKSDYATDGSFKLWILFSIKFYGNIFVNW